MTPTADPKKVFVVYGRNENVKREVFAFLRMIGLFPIPWGEATRSTNTGAPYIGKVLEAIFHEVQAVVVLLTGDDEARLIRSEFLIEDEDDKNYPSSYYQPRPNVVFEAGWAFSSQHASRTILVEVGKARISRAMVGRNRIKLSNHMKHRWQLVKSLEAAGCEMEIPNHEAIRDTGNFDFE